MKNKPTLLDEIIKGYLTEEVTKRVLKRLEKLRDQRET